MGMLVDGQWHDVWYDTEANKGKFEREKSAFRNWLTADGSPGPSGEGGFAAEAGRYHLYVSLACPWAHRTLIMRALKGLEAIIPVSIVHWHMAENGWTFAEGPGVVPDPIHHAQYMHQVYTAAKPDYSGRVTVPVLWDRTKGTIVSNESAEIIRMFNTAFDDLGARPGDYYPRRTARRSMPSMRGSTTPSTTASTRPVSRPPRRPTRRRSIPCSGRSTGLRHVFRRAGTLSGTP